MKKIFLLAALCVPLMLAGCAKTTGTTPPLAPGYQNSADQIMGQDLAAANGFYHTIQCETQGLNWSVTTKTCVSDSKVITPMILSATEKQAFNALATSLNVANPVYLSYHAGTATQAQAQAAIDQVKAQQNALQNMIPQAVK